MIKEILIALVINFGLWFFLWRFTIKPALDSLKKQQEVQDEKPEQQN